MKKSSLIVVVLVTLLVFGLILYFYINDDKNNIEYSKVDYTSNVEFTDKEQIIAIAYLNDIEEASGEYIDNFENIKVYQIGDEERYLIIPRYETVKISIYELKDDKENLISITKLPFIISSNKSSVMFKIEYEDKKIEYIPEFDSDDNSVNVNEYLLDITK